MIKKTQSICLIFGLSLVALSGCQMISKTSTKVTDSVMGMFGQEKSPELDAQSILDLAKASQEKLEHLLANMPKNEWVYLENPQLGTAELQNKATNNHVLSLALNCKIETQRPSFSLQNANGQVILKAYDDSAGQIQFLLDNKNFGNPFQTYQSKQLESFKTALKQAKVIKIFNASKLYSFQNTHAELLEKPVNCKTS